MRICRSARPPTSKARRGENAVGGDRLFAGSLGTQVVKVFDLAAARTGRRDHEAWAHGLPPVSLRTVADDHTAYYPGAKPISNTVTGDARSRRLLGAQLVGHRDAGGKRVGIYATAIHPGMTVDDVADLDVSYSPPLDAVPVAASAWHRRVVEGGR